MSDTKDKEAAKDKNLEGAAPPPTSSTNRVLGTTSKIALGTYIALSIACGIAYFRGWYSAFGLEEEPLRHDLITIHMRSYDTLLSIWALLLVYVIFTTAVVVIAIYPIAIFIDKTSHWFIAKLTAWRTTLSSKRRARWERWADKGMTLAAAIILVCGTITTTLLFPIAYAEHRGRTVAEQFVKRGFIDPPRENEATVPCITFKSAAEKPETALLLGCGTSHCALVRRDGNASIVPETAMVEVKVLHVKASNFPRTKAFEICAGPIAPDLRLADP